MYLDTLEYMGRSDAPSYHEFLLRYNPKKNQVFAFYEGDEDSSFYNGIIHNIINIECELECIVVGCKNDVIKLYRSFDWERFNRQQIAFFIDRDLSYWLDQECEYGPNVFVTDYYSVENYIANSVGFECWLCQFEGFARATKQEIVNMITIFDACYKAFEKSIMRVMATAIVAKRHDSSIKLNDYKIPDQSKLFYMQGDGQVIISFVDIGEKTLERWKIIPEYSEEIEKQIESFKQDSVHYSVRGKWLITFMAELGEFMRLNAKVFAPSLGKEKVCRTCSVPTSQCLVALAPYCNKCASERLLTFLHSNYGFYSSSRNAKPVIDLE